MSRENDFELSKALSRLIRISLRGNLVLPGTIVAVNDNFTCDVAIGETTMFNVPLRVLTGSQASVYEVPVVDSDCLFTFRDGNINQPQILFVDQVDQLLINCKTMVEFNGGTLGGMVKAKELKAQSEKDKAILSALLNVINGPTITEPGNGTPSALQLALKTAVASLKPGDWNNLENEKITQ